MARQDARLAETRAFLDRLWKYEGVFNPDLQCTYADRAAPQAARGHDAWPLSAHGRGHGGALDRSRLSEGVREHLRRRLARLRPVRRTHRLETREIPSPAVCSMFRTYQGWTALTRQGPNDGTLRLIPIAEGIAYVLLRALQDDVEEDGLVRGRARPRARGQPASGTPISSPRLVSIPRSCPATRSSGTPTSATPLATSTRGASTPASSTSARRRTARRIARIFRGRRDAFLQGRSAPDFAPMDFEVDFKGRATEADLTDLGRAQMGF